MRAVKYCYTTEKKLKLKKKKPRRCESSGGGYDDGPDRDYLADRHAPGGIDRRRNKRRRQDRAIETEGYISRQIHYAVNAV